MRPRKHHLRTLGGVPHLEHIGPDAVAPAVALARHLLAGGEHRLGLAEVDVVGAFFMAQDDAVHQLADLVVELLQDHIALGLAHLLHDDLAGGLRRDPAETLELDLERHFAVHLRIGIERLRLFERDLLIRVRDLGHDLLVGVHDDVAALGVDLHRDPLGAVLLLGRAHEGRLNGLDHHFLRDALFLADLVDHMNQFLTHTSVSS